MSHPDPDHSSVSDVSAHKRALRARARALLTAPREPSIDASIETAVADLVDRLDPRLVVAYAALRGEVSLDVLCSRLARRGRLVLPRVAACGLCLHRVDSMHDLTASRLGIREPSEAAPVVEPGSVALVLAPGLAFDRAGTRLGRGGGMYDRLLAELSPSCVRVGVGVAAVLWDALPREPHDAPMQGVVTELGLLAVSVELRVRLR